MNDERGESVTQVEVKPKVDLMPAVVEASKDLHAALVRVEQQDALIAELIRALVLARAALGTQSGSRQVRDAFKVADAVLRKAEGR